MALESSGNEPEIAARRRRWIRNCCEAERDPAFLAAIGGGDGSAGRNRRMMDAIAEVRNVRVYVTKNSYVVMGDGSVALGDSSRHFYIAVDRQEFKMRTFFDLLEHFWKRSGVPLVICCNARDSLDAVVAAAASRPYFHAKFLHSDLDEPERAATVDEFRRAMAEWKKGEAAPEGVPPKLFLLVVTDSCLPANSFGEPPLLARCIINYDLPLKKEAYLRRLSACLSPSQSTAKSSSSELSGTMLNIVVGGEVSTLRSIEEGCAVIINLMPINITELL